MGYKNYIPVSWGANFEGETLLHSEQGSHFVETVGHGNLTSQVTDSVGNYSKKSAQIPMGKKNPVFSLFYFFEIVCIDYSQQW